MTRTFWQSDGFDRCRSSTRMREKMTNCLFWSFISCGLHGKWKKLRAFGTARSCGTKSSWGIRVGCKGRRCSTIMKMLDQRLSTGLWSIESSSFPNSIAGQRKMWKRGGLDSWLLTILPHTLKYDFNESTDRPAWSWIVRGRYICLAAGKGLLSILKMFTLEEYPRVQQRQTANLSWLCFLTQRKQSPKVIFNKLNLRAWKRSKSEETGRKAHETSRPGRIFMPGLSGLMNRLKDRRSTNSYLTVNSTRSFRSCDSTYCESNLKEERRWQDQSFTSGIFSV